MDAISTLSPSDGVDMMKFLGLVIFPAGFDGFIPDIYGNQKPQAVSSYPVSVNVS